MMRSALLGFFYLAINCSVRCELPILSSPISNASTTAEMMLSTIAISTRIHAYDGCSSRKYEPTPDDDEDEL